MDKSRYVGAPSVEEVAIYCKESGYTIDPVAFVKRNSERGWQELEAAIPKEPNQKTKVKKQPKFIQIQPTKVNAPWL